MAIRGKFLKTNVQQVLLEEEKIVSLGWRKIQVLGRSVLFCSRFTFKVYICYLTIAFLWQDLLLCWLFNDQNPVNPALALRNVPNVSLKASIFLSGFVTLNISRCFIPSTARALWWPAAVPGPMLLMLGWTPGRCCRAALIWFTLPWWRLGRQSLFSVKWQSGHIQCFTVLQNCAVSVWIPE